MKAHKTESFRQVLERHDFVRLAGAHTAMGARLAQEAGFEAIWSSSLEVSAARCLPDASILDMSEYVRAAQHMQEAITRPVLADVDTGYGNTMNVTRMTHAYERAGITAVCMEDKLFPKLNSFAGGEQLLLSSVDFCNKIQSVKAAQESEDFFLIARTEALISGLNVEEALRRCAEYADAGADGVLIHSKSSSSREVEAFLDGWSREEPVFVVPTTYPDFDVDKAAAAGAAGAIFANQGLRATITALQETYDRLIKDGGSAGLSSEIASVSEIFRLQRLDDWLKL